MAKEKKEKLIPMTLRLRESDYQDITEKANSMGISRSNYIKSLLTNYTLQFTIEKNK